jgi:uncharacterized protein (DUF2336 family)
MTQLAPSPAMPPGPARVHGGVPADEVTRVRLGASIDSAPDLLAALAVDPAVTVRAAVALNTATPVGADRILARDDDERVRTLLARKLANLVPDLQNAERDRLQQHAVLVLAELVRDEAMRVRAAIADVVKDMPQAPRDLILRLAHDSEIPVSEPVTRLSPLLTTEDLLVLLAAAPNPATATAIASRAGLNETVSDAVAATTDAVAIRALLANHSAAIREATLDALIARAPDQIDWHAPLVRRPRLSPAAACALSEYVATHLLHEMASRADLSPECAGELKRRLEARLLPSAPLRAVPSPNMDEAMGHAHALAFRDQLNETTLLGAVQRGEARMATAMLAVAAGVPASVVDRAATLRSAKALVSLVWRAGFSMQVAGPLQSLLARTSPEAVLRGGPAGAFPLAIDEMRWQIDFLMRMGR